MPNNAATETSYSAGNVGMNGNIGLWHLNNNVSDSSGNNLTGVGQNGLSYDSGYLGSNGAVLDGTDDYISLGNSNTLNQATLSVSAWVKTTHTGNMYVFSKKGRAAGGWHAYALNVGPSWASSSSGQVSARIQQSAAPSFIDFKTSKTVNDGKWHHIVLTFDSSRVGRIHIDGVLEAISGTGSGPIYYYTNSNAYIGSSRYCGSGNDCEETVVEAPFRGNIDEVAVFNRPLGEQEVLNMYNRGANKVKFQIRSCNDNPCNGESFIGPDGTANTYFSELSNTSLNLPSFSISNLLGRYYQYKVIMQTDSANSKPEIVNIVSKYQSYALDKPAVNLTSEEDLGPYLHL